MCKYLLDMGLRVRVCIYGICVAIVAREKCERVYYDDVFSRAFIFGCGTCTGVCVCLHIPHIYKLSRLLM